MGSKLFLIDFFIWLAMIADPSHIFWLSETDPQWQVIKENLEMVSLGKNKQVVKDWEQVSGLLSIIFAGISKGSSYSQGIKQSIMNFFFMGYYFVRSAKKVI